MQSDPRDACANTEQDYIEKAKEVEIRYISPEEARHLGDIICEKYKKAFELLKDR